METIMKYPKNRKLYSHTTKSYVTIDYLINNVKENNLNFKILEYKEGVNPERMKDVTTKVLKECLNRLDWNKRNLIRAIKNN